MILEIIFVGVTSLALFGSTSLILKYSGINKKKSQEEIQHRELIDYLIDMIKDGELKPLNNDSVCYELDFSGENCHVRILKSIVRETYRYQDSVPKFEKDISKSNNTFIRFGTSDFYTSLTKEEVEELKVAAKSFGKNKLNEKFLEYKLDKARNFIKELESK